jgi:hypothetical protein
MVQQIIEAILENGQIESVSRKLPHGKLKVNLIYDKKDIPNDAELSDIIAERSGIYKNINVEEETREIRAGWDRNGDI